MTLIFYCLRKGQLAGFYDTLEEQPQITSALISQSLCHLENKCRSDDKEAECWKCQHQNEKEGQVPASRTSNQIHSCMQCPDSEVERGQQHQKKEKASLVKCASQQGQAAWRELSRSDRQWRMPRLWSVKPPLSYSAIITWPKDIWSSTQLLYVFSPWISQPCPDYTEGMELINSMLDVVCKKAKGSTNFLKGSMQLQRASACC